MALTPGSTSRSLSMVSSPPIPSATVRSSMTASKGRPCSRACLNSSMALPPSGAPTPRAGAQSPALLLHYGVREGHPQPARPALRCEERVEYAPEHLRCHAMAVVLYGEHYIIAMLKRQ